MAGKLTIFFLIMLAAGFISFASAQGIDENQRFACIKPIPCFNRQTVMPDSDARCQGYEEMKQLQEIYNTKGPEGKTPQQRERHGELGVRFGHSAKITTDPDKRPLPNKETYIVECFGKSRELSSSVCTTGNAQLDKEKFGYTNALPKLKDAYKYKFEAIRVTDGDPNVAQPRMTNGGGDFREQLEWQRSTDSEGPARTSVLRAVNFYTETNAGVGNEGGQQQGTIDFETADSMCVKIRWDPAGRVFDAKTLEPISRARVLLLKKRSGDGFTPMTRADLGAELAFQNPQTTDIDGVFNFAVPDGTYRLDITPPTNYRNPRNMSELSANYPQIYSNIYPLQTGKDIVQRGEVEFRDVPFTPAGRSQNNDPEFIEMFETVNKVNGVLVIDGRVSHPLSVIRAVNGKTVLRTVRADKYGVFKMTIDQRKYKPASAIEYEIEKVDLTKALSTIDSRMLRIVGFLNRFLAKQAYAVKSTMFKTEPIPNYLEGYAYDIAGEPIPKAQVGVYVNDAGKPYYQTTADEKGYFKITSERLPSIPYIIKYTDSAGRVVLVKTSAFLLQNEVFFKENKIDVFGYKDEQGRTSPKQAGKPSLTGQSSQVSQQQTIRNNFIVTIIILILLLVGVGAILGVYIYKKKLPVPPES